MNGHKERLMVLDMLAEGKITADEAEELFKAMEEAPEENTASDSPKLVPGLAHLSHLASLSSLSALDALSPVSPVSPPSPVSPRSPHSSASGNARTRDLLGALKDAGIDHITMSDLQE
ncbi:MAG TPA: hypothetical protein PKL78_15275, partial [Anaerolineales bacterium]|nr:hypothetical protein [Anaerolineales bacterium]